MLSDVDIRRYIEAGKIKIEPELGPLQWGSCSVDFRLGDTYRTFIDRYHHTPVDLTTDIGFRMNTRTLAPGEALVIEPGDFALAVTMEHLELDEETAGRLEGRSSLARLGIIVHGTAGLFDAGWRGRVVLELSNLGPSAVMLYPGMRICSMAFEPLSSPTSRPYYKKAGAKYAGQSEPLPSRIGQDL